MGDLTYLLQVYFNSICRCHKSYSIFIMKQGENPHIFSVKFCNYLLYCYFVTHVILLHGMFQFSIVIHLIHLCTLIPRNSDKEKRRSAFVYNMTWFLKLERKETNPLLSSSKYLKALYRWSSLSIRLSCIVAVKKSI